MFKKIKILLQGMRQEVRHGMRQGMRRGNRNRLNTSEIGILELSDDELEFVSGGGVRELSLPQLEQQNKHQKLQDVIRQQHLRQQEQQYEYLM